MRTAFVLTTIVLALALGIIAGISESRLLTRVLIIGFAPAVWAASHVVERLRGRDMWHFTAPYPYPWMAREWRRGIDAAERPWETCREHGRNRRPFDISVGRLTP